MTFYNYHSPAIFSSLELAKFRLTERVISYFAIHFNIKYFYIFLFHLVSRTFSTRTVPVAIFFTHNGLGGLKVSLAE